MTPDQTHDGLSFGEVPEGTIEFEFDGPEGERGRVILVNEKRFVQIKDAHGAEWATFPLETEEDILKES